MEILQPAKVEKSFSKLKLNDKSEAAGERTERGKFQTEGTAFL